MRRSTRDLFRSNGGAVAPTVALSLFGLIAVGGIAFDYAQLAGMDSELQSAADQAALAAASQLDGQSGACARAAAAAASLLSNQTRFASGAGAVNVQSESGCDDTGSVKFYQSWDQSSDTPGTAANSDANAKVVVVDVDRRTANYTLTPIAAAFSSPSVGAEAVASLATAICKVPPVMICNPDEGSGIAFDASLYVGKGLKLVAVGNGGSTAWAPGDFGYLDTGSSTSNPNVELREALGWTTPPGNCSPEAGVTTRTGAGTPVTQALNTRFDIYEKANSGNGNAASCPNGGSCPPSVNSVKDLVRKNAPANGTKCGVANNEWELPAVQYLPTSATADLNLSNPATVPSAMGYPRDKCHAVSNSGSCSGGKIGDGNWDRNAYFYVNYGWSATNWPTYLSSGDASARIPIGTSPSRYQVYRWEIANRGSTFGGRVVLGARSYGTGGNARTDYKQPVCGSLQTPTAPAVVPGSTTADRRVISTGVVNCTANNVHGGGGTVYPVSQWIDLFLVEPSLNRSRTDQNDVYVEIIGVNKAGEANTITRHDVPYLIK